MTADRTNPVVRTPYGAVRGRWEGGTVVFRGIPYAAPPFGPTAPKPPYSDAFALYLSDPFVVGDDCLNLNVWTTDTVDAPQDPPPGTPSELRPGISRLRRNGALRRR